MNNDKGISIMMSNIILEKSIINIYPNLEQKYIIEILNSLIYTKRDLTIDEAKILFEKHIPKISQLINWKLYYEYCVINDYLTRFEKETGLVGIELLEKLNNKITFGEIKNMIFLLNHSEYFKFVTMFKKHFSKEIIEENSVDTHKMYIEREKKLKRILEV